VAEDSIADSWLCGYGGRLAEFASDTIDRDVALMHVDEHQLPIPIREKVTRSGRAVGTTQSGLKGFMGACCEVRMWGALMAPRLRQEGRQASRSC
jgi:hypothetical protein